RQSDSFLEVIKNDLRLCTTPGPHIHRSAVHGVAARRVATVSPVKRAVGKIKIQIDGFRQSIVEELDILAIGCILAPGNLQICAEDTALTGVVIALLCPVELAPFKIYGDADAPLLLVLARTCIALTCIDKRLDV